MVERSIQLPVVDGLTLPEPVRDLLRPDEILVDARGVERRLPRWFFEIGGREAGESELAPDFLVREFLVTDVREARGLHRYPRYVPCAITLLAASLSVLRQRWGTHVFIAANGGYRSPAHALTEAASAHCWGTAANIYRVGDTYLESVESIERFAGEVRQILPGAYVRTDSTAADDHLHLDLGYVNVVPREALE
jgi:hypothetical protein